MSDKSKSIAYILGMVCGASCMTRRGEGNMTYEGFMTIALYLLDCEYKQDAIINQAAWKMSCDHDVDEHRFHILFAAISVINLFGSRFPRQCHQVSKTQEFFHLNI